MATMWGGIGAKDIPKCVRYLFAAGSLLIQLSLHDQEVVRVWMADYSHERSDLSCAREHLEPSRARGLGNPILTRTFSQL
jgi:hypothetical protein